MNDKRMQYFFFSFSFPLLHFLLIASLSSRHSSLDAAKNAFAKIPEHARTGRPLQQGAPNSIFHVAKANADQRCQRQANKGYLRSNWRRESTEKAEGNIHPRQAIYWLVPWKSWWLMWLLWWGIIG